MAAPHGEAQRHLDAATAWLDLGNWQAANEELGRLSPELQATPEALELRCCIYAEAEKWQDVEQIAVDAAATYPDNQKFPISWAWARYEQGDISGGLRIAVQAAERFPKSASAAYSVACFCGASGRLEEARRWLALAFDRAPDPDKLRLEALEEPELDGVWRTDGKSREE